MHFIFEDGAMKTNFEKYKQNMTVEELGDMVSAMGDAGSECASFCPCYEFCKASSKTGNPTDVWHVYPSAPNESECTGAVREWAKQEAKEDAK